MKIFKVAFLALLTITFFISCKKEFSYEGGNKLSGGTWQFQNGAIQYVGNIDSAFIEDLFGTKMLSLVGKSLNGQENFRIRLFATDSFTATSYLTSSFQNDFLYGPSSKTIFLGDEAAGEFIVNVLSISNNTISGTFSGLVEDSTGAQTLIVLGSFTSAIDLTNNGSGQGGPPSAGTLGANPDTCTPINISGPYAKGLLLTAANTVQVQVNVTTVGSFFITTNFVNGISFSKIGTFTSTGVQNVTLQGSGTPQNQGLQYFIVTYGNSNCTFPITFLPGTIPTGDYFPTTIGSNWAYGLRGGTPADSLLTQVISYAPTIGGKVFTSFTTENIPPSGTTDTAYYRKSGNDYINYIDITDIFNFDSQVAGEYVFLNDAVPAGTSIRSPNFNGTIVGFPISGYIVATISAKAVPAAGFSDVIKVTYEYFTTIAPTTPVATGEKWFARGVGLIYEDLDTFYTYDIGRFTVL